MTLSDPASRAQVPVSRPRVEPTAYDAPVVAPMVAELQQLYRQLYGGPDETPVSPEQFAVPHGYFVVGYAGDEPVAMGGWRFRAGGPHRGLPGRRPAEIKRMFVRPAMRGRGLARLLLAELETAARRRGADCLVLETGDRQPEAIALYRSAGYREVTPFGFYADEEGSLYLGKRL